MPLRNKFVFHRTENRILMEIPVFIDGHRQMPGSESTFTENVSAGGARVVSVRRWEQGEKLTFASRIWEEMPGASIFPQAFLQFPTRAGFGAKRVHAICLFWSTSS